MAEKYQREKKEFQRQTIKILRPVPDGERGNEIAVIRWESEGKSYAPQLVSQEIYLDRIDRKRKYGKVKGLKWGDYVFLTENPDRIAEIRHLLLDSTHGEYKPPAKRAGQDAASNADKHEDEEAPRPPSLVEEEVGF